MSNIYNDRIQVNGVSLGVEIREAEGIRQTHPTLVLIHGFTGSAASWGEHLDVFARAGLRVIALDMLGHGQSDVPEDPRRYSIERCGEDIVAALRLLNVEQDASILLGYSMGGRIALYTALSGFFRALILESASFGLPDAEVRYKRRRSDEALANFIERDGIVAFVDYWERVPLFESQRRLPQERWMRQREQRLANSEKGLANSLRGVGAGAQPPLRSRLGELMLPVLLITGELDSKYREIAQEMMTMLPDARVAVVPGAGHAAHLERADIFDSLVIDFCTSVGE